MDIPVAPAFLAGGLTVLVIILAAHRRVENKIEDRIERGNWAEDPSGIRLHQLSVVLRLSTYFVALAVIGNIAILLLNRGITLSTEPEIEATLFGITSVILSTSIFVVVVSVIRMDKRSM